MNQPKQKKNSVVSGYLVFLKTHQLHCNWYVCSSSNGKICGVKTEVAIQVEDGVLLCMCVTRDFTKGLVKTGGIWTICRISKLCAFIIPEWSLSQVPFVPPFKQSRVKRWGKLPLSPPLSLFLAHHSQCRSRGFELCACFITSMPLRFWRLYRVSSNSPRERHFQPPDQSGLGRSRLWGALRRTVIATSTRPKQGSRCSSPESSYDDTAGKLSQWASSWLQN